MAKVTKDEDSSPVLLQTYVDVLTEVARAPISDLQHWEAGTAERRAANELLRCELISDARAPMGFGGITRVSPIVLTPEGALALIQWREFLQGSKPWVKLARAAYQWLLVLVGALAGGVSGVVATRFWPTQ